MKAIREYSRDIFDQNIIKVVLKVIVSKFRFFEIERKFIRIHTVIFYHCLFCKNRNPSIPLIQAFSLTD